MGDGQDNMAGVLAEMNCDIDVPQDRFYLFQPHCYKATQGTHVNIEKQSEKRQPRFQVLAWERGSD